VHGGRSISALSIFSRLRWPNDATWSVSSRIQANTSVECALAHPLPLFFLSYSDSPFPCPAAGSTADGRAYTFFPNDLIDRATYSSRPHTCHRCCFAGARVSRRSTRRLVNLSRHFLPRSFRAYTCRQTELAMPRAKPRRVVE